MIEGSASTRVDLFYYFCRLQLPTIAVGMDVVRRHLERTLAIFAKKNGSVTWEQYLDNLYPVDWFIAIGCLEGQNAAWDRLFASRVGRGDCMLTDALRARAHRLFPRDEERQESSVMEFWTRLIASDSNAQPILPRYDGQRPLVPWLIRVYQNWHLSDLRRRSGTGSLPDDDIGLPMPEPTIEPRWRETFAQAAREMLQRLDDAEILLLGLRVRHRMSQREVAQLLNVHEGTISRRTDHLREQAVEFLGRRLTEEGWTGDDLGQLVRTELQAVLLDEPRLSADSLSRMLSEKGKRLPGA